MKRHSLLGLFVLLILAARGWGWGAEGHRVVVASAVVACPEPLLTFHFAQLPFLLDHASDPDDCSVIDPDEARRHYLDLELLGGDPLSDLPATYEEALARYGDETLKQAGTLPWTILDCVRDLTEAERAGDWERSALSAAVLSHYVADACMPLHTTVNYKGQETGNLILDDRTENRHVHVRFEVGMLRQFEAEIRASVVARTSSAKEVSDPFALVRELLRESHSHIAPLLQADRELTAKWDSRFGPEFYRDMYKRTGELATEQLARAAEATASLWLYAWTAAGRPQLPEKRAAFGEQVVLVERVGRGTGKPSTDGLASGGVSSLDRRETKVFRHRGSGYVLATADWRAAGRFQVGRALSEEEYQGFWRSLDEARVWQVTGLAESAERPVVTLVVARRGRERRLTLVAQPVEGAPAQPTDERLKRIIAIIKGVAPETPGPEPFDKLTAPAPGVGRGAEPVKGQPGGAAVPSSSAGAGTESAGGVAVP